MHCSNCGQEIGDNQLNFCGKCGKSLHIEYGNSIKSKEKKFHFLNTYIKAFLIATFFFFLSFALLLKDDDSLMELGLVCITLGALIAIVVTIIIKNIKRGIATKYDRDNLMAKTVQAEGLEHHKCSLYFKNAKFFQNNNKMEGILNKSMFFGFFCISYYLSFGFHFDGFFERAGYVLGHMAIISFLAGIILIIPCIFYKKIAWSLLWGIAIVVSLFVQNSFM